jgi:hypothetical protein
MRDFNSDTVHTSDKEVDSANERLCLFILCIPLTKEKTLLMRDCAFYTVHTSDKEVDSANERLCLLSPSSQ